MREMSVAASQPGADKACQMTTNEGARRGPQIEALLSRVVDRENLPDGQVLRLRGDPDQLWEQVVAFIDEEKECCPFFSFRACELENGVELTITGARLEDVALPKA